MKKAMTITIEVEGGNPQAKITYNGETYTVDGLALFADSEGDGNLMTFFWNKPGPAAKAVTRGFCKCFEIGDEWGQQFYRAILKGLCKVTGVRPQNEVTPEDILTSWDQEPEVKRYH